MLLHGSYVFVEQPYDSGSLPPGHGKSVNATSCHVCDSVLDNSRRTEKHLLMMCLECITGTMRIYKLFHAIADRLWLLAEGSSERGLSVTLGHLRSMLVGEAFSFSLNEKKDFYFHTTH